MIDDSADRVLRKDDGARSAVCATLSTGTESNNGTEWVMSVDKGNTLHGASNDALRENDFLTSANGRYMLYVQDDGNMVLYDKDQTPHKALWATDTNGKAVSQAIMQSDGNFVLYGFPNALWASDTDREGNCDLIMQDDGNLVIYKLMTAAWATDTNQA